MYEVPFAQGDAAHLRQLPRRGLRAGIMLGLAIVTMYGLGIGITTTVLHSEAWQDFILIPISAALSGLLLGGLPASLIGGSIGWLLGRKIKNHFHAARHEVKYWALMASLGVLGIVSLLFGLLVLVNSPKDSRDIIIVYGFMIGIPGALFTGASIWLGLYLQRWGQNPTIYRKHVHNTSDETKFHEPSDHTQE